jgi:3-deoxy-manno-octulosonate cytidylyltransferase (CMP-KDO synthetase)
MEIPNKFFCVIPARYESGRFPGKPLAEILGQSMISRVWHNANNAKMVEKVVVATDSELIYEHCKKEGCDVIYTSANHRDGASRVSEVLAGTDEPYVFELQGDQPLVGPDVIDSFLKRGREHLLKTPEIDIIQPYTEATEEHINSKDVVKVAISKSNKMLLISRHPIRSGYRTLGLYVWKRETLLDFPNMETTEYEKAETCHLLRFFLNDLYVQGILLDGKDWVEVDQPKHVGEVEEIFKKRGLS